jgi:hypothetical protein
MKKRVVNVHFVRREDMPTDVLQSVLSLPRSDSQLSITRFLDGL